MSFVITKGDKTRRLTACLKNLTKIQLFIGTEKQTEGKNAPSQGKR